MPNEFLESKPLIEDNNQSASNYEISELKRLIEENMKYTKAAYVLADKTRKYIRWLELFAIVKFILILIPIVLAIIYLPPFIKNVLSTYQEFFNSAESLSGLMN